MGNDVHKDAHKDVNYDVNKKLFESYPVLRGYIFFCLPLYAR